MSSNLIPDNWDRVDSNGNPIKFDAFVNLHGHSFFSLLDGMPSPAQIVDRTFELGQLASNISDHGVMFSIVDHFLYAKQKKQKALASFEAYVVGNHKERTNEGENARQHLVLLAKNDDAYKKIKYWCSVGCTDGFYYRPRIDDEVMFRTGGEGVIATSACLAGRIPQYIINGDMQKALEAAKHYKNFFEEFYLEIQPTMEKDQSLVNIGLLKIAEKLDIPMVATSDFHYQKRSHSKTHEILLAMQTGKLLSDPNRWKFPGDTFFIASRQEMEEMFDVSGHHRFPKDALKNALDNSVRIANSCSFELEINKHYLPNISVPVENKEFINWHNKRGNDINSDYLKYLCIKGLKQKGLTDKIYRDRLDYELQVIGDMGFNDYFLIYYDIMEFCRLSKIPVGPGRGCFTPKNRVVLNNGETKLIDQIIFGDVVVSHDEKPHSVINKFEYDCKEKIVDLSIKGNKNIECTKDHKIYAIKKIDYINGSREPKWYEAEQLEPGDYIAQID